MNSNSPQRIISGDSDGAQCEASRNSTCATPHLEEYPCITAGSYRLCTLGYGRRLDATTHGIVWRLTAVRKGDLALNVETGGGDVTSDHGDYLAPVQVGLTPAENGFGKKALDS